MSNFHLTADPPSLPFEFFRQISTCTVEGDMNMLLPIRFTEIYGFNWALAYLRIEGGAVWRVQLEKSEDYRGHMQFSGGWKEFVDHYNIQSDWTICVQYHGHDYFQVKVYDDFGVRLRLRERAFRCSCTAPIDLNEQPRTPVNNVAAVEGSSAGQASIAIQQALLPNEDNRSISLTPCGNFYLSSTIKHGYNSSQKFPTRGRQNEFVREIVADYWTLIYGAMEWDVEVAIDSYGNRTFTSGWKDFIQANGIQSGLTLDMEVYTYPRLHMIVRKVDDEDDGEC